MYTGENHTFVICAYRENPYLEDAIRSVLNQTVKSNVILSTSTPNIYISGLCEKYQIPLMVNPGPHGLGNDWNYGYNQANTELVTIVHQDDLYSKFFLQESLNALNSTPNPLFSFTDYCEMREGKKVERNLLLTVKRIMNFPLRFHALQGSVWLRKRLLSFGCAICCPSVTLVKSTLGDSIFNTVYRNSCDYKTWVEFAEKKGRFVYVPKRLILHRIYPESTTTLNLSENIRKSEDLEILSTLWPKPIARVINRVYAMSEKSNQI